MVCIKVSSPELRGKLSSVPALLLAFGVLLGYVFGRLLLKSYSPHLFNISESC